MLVAAKATVATAAAWYVDFTRLCANNFFAIALDRHFQNAVYFMFIQIENRLPSRKRQWTISGTRATFSTEPLSMYPRCHYDKYVNWRHENSSTRATISIFSFLFLFKCAFYLCAPTAFCIITSWVRLLGVCYFRVACAFYWNVRIVVATS